MQFLASPAANRRQARASPSWPEMAEHLRNAVGARLVAWSSDAARAGGVRHVAVADGAGCGSGPRLEPLPAVSIAAASASVSHVWMLGL